MGLKELKQLRNDFSAFIPTIPTFHYSRCEEEKENPKNVTSMGCKVSETYT